MIDFKQQEKKAKGENKSEQKRLLKKIREKRFTQQERIEKRRYEKLKKIAKENKISISKLLDDVIDHYLEKYWKVPYKSDKI